MRKTWIFASLAAIIMPVLASAAGPGNDQWGFRKRFGQRAAPWFLYWPYGAYWTTPAPTGYPMGYGPMTAGPYVGQIGPAAGMQPHVGYGPTGFDY